MPNTYFIQLLKNLSVFLTSNFIKQLLSNCYKIRKISRKNALFFNFNGRMRRIR